MNKLVLTLFLSFSIYSASSQRVYFIYLQSENQHPFFVKSGEKIISSSASGYLIMSKLVDSTYNFKVGFNNNNWPEQQFSVTLNKKDHGFLLKDFKEKGWGLFDLQSLQVIMNSNNNIPAQGSLKSEKTSEYDESAFTNILAKVADDPSLKEKNTVSIKKDSIEVEKPAAGIVNEDSMETKIEEKKLVTEVEATNKPEEVKVEPKADIVALAEKNENDLPVKPANNKVVDQGSDLEKVSSKMQTGRTVSYSRSIISKRSESSTTEGFGLEFIDKYEEGVEDTIRILIPNPKPLIVKKSEAAKEEKKFIDIAVVDSSQPAQKKAESQNEAENAQKTENKALINDNCVAKAAESDFFNLRKNMASVQGEENMILEAKTYFKTKCFTTEQVKNLSSLFLTDEGRYRFFDTAYKYVTDLQNYPVLEIELRDEYYKNRFKAMLR